MPFNRTAGRIRRLTRSRPTIPFDLWGDFYLNFIEGIDIFECETNESAEAPSREGRGFAASNGVTSAVKALTPDDAGLNPVLVDGLDAKTIRQMKVWATKSCPGNFVEVMSCNGGCIAGPGTLGNPRIALRQLKKLLDESDPIQGD